MTVSGSGTASCCTRSTTPSLAAMSSRSSSVTFWTFSRIRSTRRMVNAPATSFRSRECSGASSEMIISGVVCIVPPTRGRLRHRPAPG